MMLESFFTRQLSGVCVKVFKLLADSATKMDSSNSIGAYFINDLEDLQDAIEKYHPIG